jgi:hypothetical protein
MKHAAELGDPGQNTEEALAALKVRVNFIYIIVRT